MGYQILVSIFPYMFHQLAFFVRLCIAVRAAPQVRKLDMAVVVPQPLTLACTIAVPDMQKLLTQALLTRRQGSLE
jgi:hypothetical protein